MLFWPWRTRAACRGCRVVIRTFGITVILWICAVDRPAASLHHTGPRRSLSKPPPVKQGMRKNPGPLSIAAVMDGDVVSIKAVEDFAKQLQKHGKLVQSSFFAEPRRLESQRWRSCLASNSIEFVPVDRGSKSFRDPTDDAICYEVHKMLQVPHVGAVALLVGDADYVSLAKDITGAGKQCLVFMMHSSPGQALQFTRAGARIIGKTSLKNQPKYRFLLRSDGTGDIEPMAKETEVDGGIRHDASLLASKLRGLDHHPGPGCLVAAIAKLWHDNDLGDLIVYPTPFAINSLAAALRENPTLAPSRHDLAFIFPVVLTGSTKSTLQAYGTAQCAQYVRGGGPFMQRDSPTMVDELLRKLGFIDNDKNACLEEGLEVFAGMSYNAREMRKTEVRIEEHDTSSTRLEKIRKVVLSNSFSGTLQRHPSDTDIRTYFVKRGLLSSVSAPADEVFYTMASYLKSVGHLPSKTYNSRVVQCLNVCFGRLLDPSSRQ